MSRLMNPSLGNDHLLHKVRNAVQTAFMAFYKTHNEEMKQTLKHKQKQTRTSQATRFGTVH
jgi:hypothetical protein